MMGPHIQIIADDDVTCPTVLRIDGKINHIRVPRAMFNRAMDWLPAAITAAANLRRPETWAPTADDND